MEFSKKVLKKKSRRGIYKISGETSEGIPGQTQQEYLTEFTEAQVKEIPEEVLNKFPEEQLKAFSEETPQHIFGKNYERINYRRSS